MARDDIVTFLEAAHRALELIKDAQSDLPEGDASDHVAGQIMKAERALLRVEAVLSGDEDDKDELDEDEPAAPEGEPRYHPWER